jgi:hypothetical protein
MTIANSTIAQNVAEGGPGSRYRQPLCMFQAPGGSGSGGGIYTAGRMTIANSTIAGNTAAAGSGNPSGNASSGGMDTSAEPTLTNTILATNAAATSGPDCAGVARSFGHNLLGNDAACSGFTAVGDLVDVDPMLGPLQGNGGPTFTMALLLGSPAIDAGDDPVCATLPVGGIDQRGVVRPQGPHCDMGAYEKQ